MAGSPRSRAARALLAASLLALGAAIAPAAGAVVVERVVAVIGDKPILLSDLRARAKPFLVQIQAKVPAGAQRAAAESQMFKELLDKIVDEELEALAAQQAKVGVTSDEIDAAFRNIAASQGVGVEELFRLARATSGLSDQEYRDEIRRQILEGKMLQLRVKGRVRITDDDVRAMFDRVRRDERRRSEYHPAWIVLRVLPGSSAAAVAERRALAESLAARARSGEDFAALATRFSDDSATRDAGGDLGVRAPQGSQAALTGQRDVMPQDLEDALMELEPGQVTSPIEAGGSLVVMKLLSRKPSRYTTLEAAQNEMVGRLQTEILEKAKRKWLDELRRRTHVDVRL
jgi:peptidyl-prolyl cis-trans isomerase SurA